MLRQCLSNLLSQSFHDMEIIVLDNASTDNTAEVVRAFADPRIRYLCNDHNIGGFANWMLAAKQGSGEFLVMHQDDDFIHPDFLRRCHETVADNSEVTMYGGTYVAGSTQAGYSAVVLADLEGGRDNWPLLDQPQIVDGRRMALRFLLSYYLNHPALALRRSALERVGGYNILGDMVTLPRVMALGQVAFDPRLSGVYRIHATRTSKNFGKAERAQRMRNSYACLVRSYEELMPGWEELLRKELATVPLKPLYRVLKDMVGFDAPPALTRIIWQRFRDVEPDRLRLYRKVARKIGLRGTLRLLLGIQQRAQ